VTRDLWIAAHPYLRPLADLQAAVDSVLAKVDVPAPAMSNLDGYRADFRAGIPLLRSTRTTVKLGDAERVVLTVIQQLAAIPLPGALAQQGATANPALLRYVGCTVLARYLRPIVRAFGEWRDHDRWLRNYCPICGEKPAMGQLIGKDPGRLRLLSCGCCRARWRYRRTGCPFCETADDHRLAVVEVDGEGGLRIDYCMTCYGYLKTYNGEGSEEILLADWTSLHLDMIARERGLKRLAASLYDL
jgi:FdhE protein